MLLINKNEKPIDTIYYISACVFSEIRKEKIITDIDKFYYEVKSKYFLNSNYDNFIYAINFLYLINKVDFQKEALIYVN